MAHVIRAPGETTPAGGYVHGYRRREQGRLDDQAGALADLLHAGTAYPPGTVVLEVGCGVGSQTLTLARRSPETRFVSVDVSADSVSLARRRIIDSGVTNVDLYQADVCPTVPAGIVRSRLRLLRPGAPVPAA
jgi:tRNA G46 methylase TrmB